MGSARCGGVGRGGERGKGLVWRWTDPIGLSESVGMRKLIEMGRALGMDKSIGMDKPLAGSQAGFLQAA